MPAHAHPMVSKSDVASLNERYAPWRIEKSHVRDGQTEDYPLGKLHFVTQARNTETGEVIYRCEGWSQASRGQALNAILAKRQSTESEGSPMSSDRVVGRDGRLIQELTGEKVTSREIDAVIAWCREWVADVEGLAIFPETGEIESDSFNRASLLRHCDEQIIGGLSFVLSDVRRLAEPAKLGTPKQAKIGVEGSHIGVAGASWKLRIGDTLTCRLSVNDMERMYAEIGHALIVHRDKMANPR